MGKQILLIKETNRVPQRWKKAKMIPIYKNKGERGIPSNYRGISLLSTIFKIHTGILTARLKEWCDEFNIISQCKTDFTAKDG